MKPEELHDLINQNKDHPYFGTLLLHWNPSYVCHPSVQLNENFSLGWEPVSPGVDNDLGWINVWKAVWDGPSPWKAAADVKYWGKDKTLQALHASVDIFHEKWEYDLGIFNCEHWARGVVSGEFRSLQLDSRLIRAFLNIAGRLKLLKVQNFEALNESAQIQILHALSNN